MGNQSAAARKPPLDVRIDRERAHPLAWKVVVKHAVFVVIAGLAIYLVFPAITEVLASWPKLSTLDPRWFAVTIAAEVGHFCCTFTLQRLALRTRAWFPVITSQLAGNAITLITPGGAAAGAAVQVRMLTASGIDTTSTVSGLAAFTMLGVGGLLALPLFALPVLLVGAYTDRGLVNAAILGAVAFVLATLTYRLASYWAPLIAGPIAYGLFRLRYRRRQAPHKPTRYTPDSAKALTLPDGGAESRRARAAALRRLHKSGSKREGKIRANRTSTLFRGTPVTLAAWRKPLPTGSRTTAPEEMKPRSNPRLPAARWLWLPPQRIRAPKVSSFPSGPKSWAGAVQLG